MPIDAYRFSDVVKAIDTTPKSFRRWLITLDMKPEDGGWHEFAPIEVLQFGIMRHLVDWRAPVQKAAGLSHEAITILIFRTDDWSSLPLETGEEIEAALRRSGVMVLGLKALVLKLKKHRLVLMRDSDGEFLWALDAPKPWWSVRGRRASQWAGVHGSFLTVDVPYLAYALAERLGEDMNVPPVE